MFDPSRFEGNKGEIPEAAPQAPPTELELRVREQELKARYEDPRRKVQAKELLRERTTLRQKDVGRMEELKKRLSDTKEDAASLSVGQKKNPEDVVSYNIKQFKQAEADVQGIKQKQENRSIFQKLKYRLVEDPLEKEIEKLSQSKEVYRSEFEENTRKIKEIESKWKEYEEEKTQNLLSLHKERKDVYISSKKALLEKTGKINRASREAIRNTFLSMEQGELAVSKLAKEANAVVVHAIPLDGWDMRNTSMNNKEVDVENLTAKEKASVVLEKQPDLSASVLNVGETMEGQDMFYPFGYILDGTLIAAYEGDEGTRAIGDSRRRKEEFHGTLQSNAKDAFHSVAHSPADKNFTLQYNESIVHKPVLKGVILDERALVTREDLGDNVVEYLPPEKEDEIMAKYGESLLSTTKGVPTKGPHAGKEIFRIERKRTGMEKALEYAKEHHPELPVYVRRADGVYDMKGKKVSGKEIYS